MKTMLCLIVFPLLPVTKLCPAIAGRTVSSWGLHSSQLRDVQPPIEKRGFPYAITTFSSIQKEKRKGANGNQEQGFALFIPAYHEQSYRCFPLF